MKIIIDVQTGEVKVGREKVILKSNAIGSCVVIAAYDSGKKIGALAHIMLPEHSPSKKHLNKTRYAADAIDELLERMKRLGADCKNIETCLVGGGNILRRKDDTICGANINSVTKILNKKDITIRAHVLGGRVRRSISLDVGKGNAYYSEGDEAQKLLHSFSE